MTILDRTQAELITNKIKEYGILRVLKKLAVSAALQLEAVK